MNIFESILREDKTARINKLKNLDDTEKQTVIAFFKQHSNLENQIDWNNKNLSMEDFNQLIQANTKSRSKRKKAIQKDLTLMFEKWVDSDQAIIWDADPDYIFVSPLSHECAVFMNSFDCYGTGAKWCIGSSVNDSDEHWREYVINRQSAFVMVFVANTQKKYMIERDANYDNYTLWSPEDHQMIKDAEFKEIIDKIPEIVITEDQVETLEWTFYNELSPAFEKLVEEGKDENWRRAEELVFETVHSYIMRGDIEIKDIFSEVLTQINTAMGTESYYDEYSEEYDMAHRWTTELIQGIFSDFKKWYMEYGSLNPGWSEESLIELKMIEICPSVDTDLFKEGGPSYEEGKAKWQQTYADWRRELEKSHGQQFLFESILRRFG